VRLNKRNDAIFFGAVIMLTDITTSHVPN